MRPPAQRDVVPLAHGWGRPWHKGEIRPRVGFSDMNSRRRSEVLPAPDGPVRNWNEPGSMRNVRSRRTSEPTPYRKPTFSNRTTPFSDHAAGGAGFGAASAVRSKPVCRAEALNDALTMGARTPSSEGNPLNFMVSDSLTDGC